MTLENFVSTYLAKQYDTTPADFAVETYVQRYPKSPIYENDETASGLGAVRWSTWKWIGPTLLSVMIFSPMFSLLTEIVRERQFKMKDLLEISGLMNVSYWFSYLALIVVIAQPIIWVCVLMLLATNIFTTRSVGPYFGLLMIYSMSLPCFSMFFGHLVVLSEYYGLACFVLNVALTVAGSVMTLSHSMSVGTKLCVCFLHPSIAFSMGIFGIESYLHHHSGDFDGAFVDTARGLPSLNGCVGVMFLSSLVYYLVVLGMPFAGLHALVKDPKFALVRFVFGPPLLVDQTNEKLKTNDRLVLLEAKNLTHIYPDGTKAVSDVSFNIHEGTFVCVSSTVFIDHNLMSPGEVLSLIGSNGAGKSTCMGMLCGTLDATFGDAKVNGFSITTDRTMARRNLGIAMQQDIIWDDVSVEDHLYLFGSLRGMFGDKLREDVNKMLEDLGFPEKRKSLAGTLSGGQKRRLCVGISMVGGNSVVYLDEPTAGLDPVSRRQLWELVEKNRAGRAILLTTHFMDEADVLGDRIAIVKEGSLCALDTSQSLKQQFGQDYLLKMSLMGTADVSCIVARMADFVPAASIASNAGTELSLRLPKEAVGQFPAMFERLESESKSLGVLSYGIETTTLEEVFMRIVNEDTEQLLTNHEEAKRLLTASISNREENSKRLQARDEGRHPLKQVTVCLTFVYFILM
jgi:ATP-binding cassette subfamily A (ABC1) protein 3